MKRISDALRLLLPVTAIILLVLHLMGKGGESMCMGLGIGVCFGVAIDAAKRSKAGEEKKDEEDQ